MMELTRDDLIILAPCVLDELSQTFSFTHGEVITGSGLGDGIYAAFPKTMAKRAYEAITSGEPVWDRVNNQVWLPLSSDDGGAPPMGAMTLKGVERTVVPEEGARWLPVLSALVGSLYALTKKKSLTRGKRGIPEYLTLLLKAQGRVALYPNMTHLLFCEKGPRWREDCPTKVFKRAISCGSTDGTCAWWLVEGEPKKIPVYFEKLSRLGAKKVFLFEREDYGDEDALLREKEALEAFSRRLGLSCLSPYVLSRLREKAQIEDVAHFFSSLEDGLSRKKGRERGATIIGLHGGKGAVLSENLVSRDGISLLYESNGVAFYQLTGAVSHGLHGELSQIARSQGIKVSITPTNGLGPRPELLKMLFWTGVHGSLLEGGSVFQGGSITCQVAGDECFSHGDIHAAIQYYKAAMRLDAGNVDALNSLGVSYARVGRRKFAHDSFRRAIDLAPEDPMGYYNLGCLLMDSRDVDGAVKALERAYKNSAHDPFIVARYLEALLELGEDQGAEKVLGALEALLKEQSPPPWVLRVVARARYLLGDMRKASLVARKVLAVRPNDPEALFICAAALKASEGASDGLKKVIAEIDATKMTSHRLKAHYFLFKNKK